MSIIDSTDITSCHLSLIFLMCDTSLNFILHFYHKKAVEFLERCWQKMASSHQHPENDCMAPTSKNNIPPLHFPGF